MRLKHKKLIQQQLEKVDNAEMMLNDTVVKIESAAADVQIMEAMTLGNNTLKELQKQVSVEEFEEIYDNLQEAQAIQDREIELFGAAFNTDELEDELNAMAGG